MAFNRTEPILVHGIIGDGMHAQPQHAHAVQAAVARAARDLRLHKAQLPQRLQSPGHPLVLGRNGDAAHGRPLFHDDYTIPVRGLRALRPRARG